MPPRKRKPDNIPSNPGAVDAKRKRATASSDPVPEPKATASKRSPEIPPAAEEEVAGAARGTTKSKRAPSSSKSAPNRTRPTKAKPKKAQPEEANPELVEPKGARSGAAEPDHGADAPSSDQENASAPAKRTGRSTVATSKKPGVEDLKQPVDEGGKIEPIKSNVAQGASIEPPAVPDSVVAAESAQPKRALRRSTRAHISVQAESESDETSDDSEEEERPPKRAAPSKGGATKSKANAPRLKTSAPRAKKAVDPAVKEKLDARAADIKEAKKQAASSKRKAFAEAKKASAKEAGEKKGRRGLSFEEKLCRFEEYMSKHESIYTLKELEKIAPTIGVIPQATKDVIVALLKERRIKCEKVGASNIYWLFKADLAQARRNEEASLKSTIGRLETERQRLLASAGGPTDAPAAAKLPASCEAELNDIIEKAASTADALEHLKKALLTKRLQLREAQRVIAARETSVEQLAMQVCRRLDLEAGGEFPVDENTEGWDEG